MEALIIIDMQMEMQRRMDTGAECVNADAPERIAAIAAHFRQTGRQVLHVRHSGEDPASPFHPDAAGHVPMPCAQAMEGEAVFQKRTSSALASGDLQAHLKLHGITDLVITGAVAGFCVNSTARQAADQGFAATVVRDAVIGFALPEAGLSARTIFDVTMALLEADFTQVTDTSALLAVRAPQAVGRPDHSAIT